MKTFAMGWAILLATVPMLCGCEAPVNSRRDDFGFLEIHKAAREGNTALVRQLIERGAKVNLADLDGITPLHTAAKNNFLELATVLLKAHADPAMATNDGWDAVQLAAWKEHREMVELLLSYGAVASRKTHQGWSAVHMAAFRGNQPILDTLNRDWPSYAKTGKPSFNDPDDDGDTPLHLALKNGHTSLVNFLVLNGADPNLKDAEGNTALHLAIPQGDVEAVRFLVQEGADVNARDNAGKTPYTRTVEQQNAAMAQIIWTAGGTESAVPDTTHSSPWTIPVRSSARAPIRPPASPTPDPLGKAPDTSPTPHARPCTAHSCPRECD